jgi:hypothetical protein
MVLEDFPLGQFNGELFSRPAQPAKFGDYEKHAYQHAFTSHGLEGGM